MKKIHCKATSVIELQVVEEEVLTFLFILLVVVVNFAARRESTRIITEVRI
jgi:hypothetical protein